MLIQSEPDYLSDKYLNRNRNEVAPDGFTSRVMSRIQLDTEPVRRPSAFRDRLVIPLVAITFTGVLVIIALLIPDNKSILENIPLFKQIFYNGVKIPAIDFSTIFKFTVPATVLYIIIGIAALSLFDKTLSTFFRSK